MESSEPSRTRIRVISLLAVAFLLLSISSRANASTIAITNPVVSVPVVTGTITVTASTTTLPGPSGVSVVLATMSVWIDQTEVATGIVGPPFAYTWNSTGFPNGQHTITVQGYDSANVFRAQADVIVNVVKQCHADADRYPYALCSDADSSVTDRNSSSYRNGDSSRADSCDFSAGS